MNKTGENCYSIHPMKRNSMLCFIFKIEILQFLIFSKAEEKIYFMFLQKEIS